MTVDNPLPYHPLLIKAIQSRLRQNMKLMFQRCRQFETATQNQKIHPWDLVHHQLLISLAIDLEQNLEERFRTFLNLKLSHSNLNLSNSFLFRYELSGIFIRRRQYALALAEALAATTLSFDANSSISSEINAVICQESLGFEVSHKLEKIGHAISKLSKRKLNPKIYSEYHALSLRLYFRLGQIDKIAQFQSSNLLYLAWLKHLPQLGLKPSNLKLSMNKSQAFYSFICNTILFRYPPEDLKSPPINHWIDRLYLWTWTSIVNPCKIPIGSILQILEDLRAEEISNTFTAEDKIMLCHCILLISLFDPSTRKQALHFINRLGPIQYNSHPFLRLERDFIDDLTSVLLSEPLVGKKKEYRRIAFFRQISPLHKSKIRKYLPGLNINFLGTHSFDFSKIIIDLAHCRVWDHKQKKWLCSEGLALGFLFFIQRSELSAINSDEFMNSVFGISSYDESVHYRNIYNILSRMKTISSGAFFFSIRRQIINFQIDKSQFQSLETEVRAEFNRALWRKILSPTLKKSGTKVSTSNGQEKIIFQLQLHGPCHRQQLQSAADFSKAKMLRTLNKMLKDNKIRRFGKGKNSEYEMA